MRQASIILRNLMAEAHNAYNSGQLLDKAKLAAMEFLANCVKDYIRAQKEIVPYEDAKLVNLAAKTLFANYLGGGRPFRSTDSGGSVIGELPQGQCRRSYQSELAARLPAAGLLDAGAHERNRQKVAVRLDNNREAFQ
jgi:hypothetical protein